MSSLIPTVLRQKSKMMTKNFTCGVKVASWAPNPPLASASGEKCEEVVECVCVCVYTRARAYAPESVRREENGGLTHRGLCLALRGGKETVNEATRIKR